MLTALGELIIVALLSFPKSSLRHLILYLKQPLNFYLKRLLQIHVSLELGYASIDIRSSLFQISRRWLPDFATVLSNNPTTTQGLIDKRFVLFYQPASLKTNYTNNAEGDVITLRTIQTTLTSFASSELFCLAVKLLNLPAMTALLLSLIRV